MTGMLIRNSPIKGMVEKIGGVETLERTVKDPETMEMFQEMLKDPEFMAEMSKSIAKELGEFMKTDDKLPGKK